MTFVLTAIVLTLSGCETTKGMAEGMGKDINNTASNTKEAAVGSYTALKKTDDWMRENMW